MAKNKKEKIGKRVVIVRHSEGKSMRAEKIKTEFEALGIKAILVPEECTVDVLPFEYFAKTEA